MNVGGVTDEEVEAVDLLTAKGWGVVEPSGLWWNRNIARADPGALLLSTAGRPFFGMVNRHRIQPSEEEGRSLDVTG